MTELNHNEVEVAKVLECCEGCIVTLTNESIGILEEWSAEVTISEVMTT